MRRKAISNYVKGNEIHISFKVKGWERGWIKEEPGQYSIILNFTEIGREKHGVKSKEYFFLEMNDIQEYMEERK